MKFRKFSFNCTKLYKVFEFWDMKAAKNPFAPGAGTQPPELTGRSGNLKSVEVVLERVISGKSVRSVLLIGLRGVGKTVLLNRIHKMAEEENYETVFIETPEGKPLAELLVPHLRQVLLRLDLVEGSKEKLRKAIAALRAFASTFEIKIGDLGVGVRAPGLADSGSLEADIIDLLVAVGEAAQEASTGVAICLDELQYIASNELAALLAGIHRIGQKNLPLVFFGAGLPQLTGLSGKAKSYAERLFEFQKIGQLDEDDAKLALREPIEKAGAYIDDDALEYIFEITEGYPYFLQEWGAHAWNRALGSPITIEDARAATEDAINTLDESFFRVRFDRLTKGEKEYLRAMAELGPGAHRSGDIAKVLGKSAQTVAPTRANVISKGMVYAPAYGDNAFTVPKFDEYMKRVMPEFKPAKQRKPSETKK